MLTLAHLSDPHVGPLPRPRLSELLGKRVTGYLSWQWRRRAIHDGPVLALMAADLLATAPDHVAVTGDLVNISLADEYPLATAWLERLGSPATVTVIPGNHDAYVDMPWERSYAAWADYMAADAAPMRSAADFPSVRVRGDVALIGVSTACPMPPFSAAGRIGEAQLARLREHLTRLGRDGLFRVILIHHPPFDGRGHRRKRLLDSAGFRRVVAEVGAELVLHGHTHRAGLGKLPTPFGTAPVIGVRSASAQIDYSGRGRAQYHVYRIARTGPGWTIDVEVRGVTAKLDGFVPEGKYSLAVPHA